MAAREKAGLSYESLSSMTNIPSITLENYERCESPVPISDIELLSKALLVPLDALLDQNSVIGAWRKREELEGHVEALPDDLLQFMSQPVNRPFLELAKKLSDLSVERLRAVAEGLLEITY
jgi:transcriptional regulator with XRE-family HTH domain